MGFLGKGASQMDLGTAVRLRPGIGAIEKGRLPPADLIIAVKSKPR